LQKSDNREYKKKANALIELYNNSKVLGKKVDGKRTLSENIADLAGVGISLHAFKAYLLSKNIVDENIKKEAYKKFFIAYAVSWRVKYKDEKLKLALEIDKHSPAFLRVNNIVSQFDEWYEAFDTEKETEDLIRIF
jgi:putative endopeptidase